MLAILEEGDEDVTVPPTIQALLAARLDRLPADQRRGLQRAATAGGGFPPGGGAAPLPQTAASLQASLDELVRRDLLKPAPAAFPGEDTYRFCPVLVRDAAFDSLP